MILARVKANAERQFGVDVDRAVITVPAAYADVERQAIRDAAKIAGLQVVRFLTGSTAAAVADGWRSRRTERVLSFDLGAGSFDISIVESGDNIFDVRSVGGHARLGGNDLDEVITDWLADEYDNEHGLDLRERRSHVAILRTRAEAAKVELSTARSTTVSIPAIDGRSEFKRVLTRKRFERMATDVLGLVAATAEHALEEFDGQFDRVILVGGASRTPAIRKVLKAACRNNGFPSASLDSTAAARGAALQAAVISKAIDGLLILDVTPLTIGIETKGDVMTPVIWRNTTIPARKSETFSTAEDNQPSVQIHVLQGQRDKASENLSLGKFQLADIPKAPRGVPQIEVTFLVEADGSLNVTATDLATGSAQEVRSVAARGLTKRQLADAKSRLRDAPIGPTRRPRSRRKRRETATTPLTSATAEGSARARAGGVAPDGAAAGQPVAGRTDQPNRPLSVFYSYSHADEEYREQLEVQLYVMKRQTLIEEWHDRKLEPGVDWSGTIDERLKSADVILLLLSPDFLASDFCWDIEVETALRRHADGEAIVVPIILRHCAWAKTPLAALQALPKDGFPVKAWPDRDEAWLSVATALHTVFVKARRDRAGSS